VSPGNTSSVIQLDRSSYPPRPDAVNLLSEPESKLRTNTRPSRILVVEDERIVARYLSARLSKLDYDVTGFASSKGEALQLAESTRPDLVLMDIRLNGAPEGIDAAREIRDRFAIPVVYLTAHSDSATLEQTKETGPYGYLLKPFEERDLLVTIETAISRHRTEKQLRDGEARLRLAQKAGGLGVFDWNLETGEVLLTPELEELYEMSTKCLPARLAATGPAGSPVFIWRNKLTSSSSSIHGLRQTGRKSDGSIAFFFPPARVAGSKRAPKSIATASARRSA
jgi:CheY-like chemotaxis protein